MKLFKRFTGFYIVFNNLLGDYDAISSIINTLITEKLQN